MTAVSAIIVFEVADLEMTVLFHLLTFTRLFFIIFMVFNIFVYPVGLILI